jgi:hypothetical protein
MAESSKFSNGKARSKLAYIILGFSLTSITILAYYAIKQDPTEARNIFNVILPVFASWVGTVLAFYYGRENFESANQEVRKMVQQLTPEQRSKELVSKHMRPLLSMAYFQILKGKSDADYKLSELRTKFGGNITRLPIIDADKKPKYMIHESSLNKYTKAGGQDTDTLETFINNQKAEGIEYGFNKGFIVVSEQVTLGAAKRKMEDTPTCQDIFITKEGSKSEPLSGWISDKRMSKLLEV